MPYQEELIKKLNRLPKKEKDKILNRQWTTQELEEEVKKCEESMKWDVYFGIPWALFYLLSLWQFGNSVGTKIILILGIVYFLLSFVRIGSYAMRRRKVGIYKFMIENGKF